MLFQDFLYRGSGERASVQTFHLTDNTSMPEFSVFPQNKDIGDIFGSDLGFDAQGGVCCARITPKCPAPYIFVPTYGVWVGTHLFQPNSLISPVCGIPPFEVSTVTKINPFEVLWVIPILTIGLCSVGIF